MGFLEKVKNMFTEEVEDDDVKVEKVDKVKKEIITSFEENSPQTDKKVEFGFEEEVEDTKPVFLDDDAFKDLEFTSKVEVKSGKEEVKEKEEYVEEKQTRQDKYARKGNYKDNLKESFSKEEIKEEEQPEKKIFKPTPIISPVYGILDKNYHKEDIVSKKEVKSISSEPSIEQVRNKAYGTLEDELENTLFGDNSPLLNRSNEDEKDSELEKISTDDLDSITDDISRELDELLLKKEKHSGKKKKKTEDEDDLLNFIDSTLYKEGGEEE